MPTQTFLLSGTTSYADPGDWNNGNNVIQAIGPGGSGSLRRTTARGGFGGGGGAHAADADVTPTFPVSTTVPAGTSQTKTAFGTIVLADFGKDGATTAGGLGGSVAGSTGTAAYLFAGGAATYSGIGSVGGGGGGGGGPHGTGQAASTTSGAAANGTTSPNPTTSVAAGVAGRAGTQWTATRGAGSGAGGATLTGAATGIGLVGGAFGGGGSGCHSGYTGATLGAGGDGLIAITYDTLLSRNWVTNSAFTGSDSGTLPSPHSFGSAASGLTYSYTGNGVDANGYRFIKVNFTGVAAVGTSCSIWFSGDPAQLSTLAIPPSVPMIGSVYYRLSAGAMTGIGVTALQVNYQTSAGSFLSQSNVTASTPTSSLQRATSSGVSYATSALAGFTLLFTFTSGASFNFTLELSAPQLELGDVASTALSTPVIPWFQTENSTMPDLIRLNKEMVSY